MRRSIQWCVFLGVLTLQLGSPIRLLGGEESTRTFPAQKCRFTLPGADWTWNDSRPAKLIFMAQNTKGFVINLAVTPTPQPGQVDQQFAKGFEDNFYKAGQFKKRGGHFLPFRGLQSYQAESILPDGRTLATRVFIAHGLGYIMTVLGAKEPIEDDPAFEKLLEGFEFTEQPLPPAAGQPQPAADSDFGRALNISRLMGQIVGACIIVAIPVLVFQWIARKRKSGKPTNLGGE